MTGVELIAAERQRQIEQEGYTPEHDDSHTKSELARAAACYATPVPYWTDYMKDFVWPFEAASWKPSEHDRIRELVKAGALIAAEIDRLQRQK